jgi:hypothetical protein
MSKRMDRLFRIATEDVARIWEECLCEGGFPTPRGKVVFVSFLSRLQQNLHVTIGEIEACEENMRKKQRKVLGEAAIIDRDREVVNFLGRCHRVMDHADSVIFRIAHSFEV